MIYLVESSVIIDYLREKEKAVELVEELKGEMVSSYVCLAELYEGIYRVKNQVHASQAVNQFFASMRQVYGVDAAIASQFGKLRAEMKKKGNVIEDMDLLIAATCLAYDLVLVTRNRKHFSRVAGLKLA